MGSSSTTTQRADPWAPAQPFLRGALNDAGALYDAGGFNIQPYGGDMVADWNPYQNAAYGGAAGVSAGAMGNAANASGVLGAMMDPNAQSDQFNQVLQNTISGIMPQINSSFAGSGMTGSGLHAQNLARGVSAGVADTLNSNWTANQNRALQAAGMVPGINAAAMGANDYLNQYGAGAQSQSQNEINANVLQDQQRQTAAMNAIQDYMSLISGVGSAFGVQSSRQSQSPGLLGMMGFGLQAAPLLFSDERLKEDIKKVGQTDDGLPIYTYRYKGFPTVHMGVLAQEVEKVMPEAVVEQNGYKAVNYGAF